MCFIWGGFKKKYVQGMADEKYLDLKKLCQEHKDTPFNQNSTELSQLKFYET